MARRVIHSGEYPVGKPLGARRAQFFASFSLEALAAELGLALPNQVNLNGELQPPTA